MAPFQFTVSPKEIHLSLCRCGARDLLHAGEQALANGFIAKSGRQMRRHSSNHFVVSTIVVNPTFIVQSASISRSQTSGDPVTVSATVTNTSTVNGVAKVRLYVNGQLDSEQAVAVAPGRQILLSFTVSRNEPGAYQVYVNGTPAGSFTVSDSSIVLYVSLACLFLALILGVMLIYKKFTT
jgi:hypothetical protein